MSPHDLIATAKHLATLAPKRPKQSDLKRAVSTAYYAVFHALAQTCADSLIGAAKTDRANNAWRQTYRALDHGYAKDCCQSSKIIVFPKPIQDFASVFVELQIKRHLADYDPFSRFHRSEVVVDVGVAEKVIDGLEAVPTKHRKAFAVWVLLKRR